MSWKLINFHFRRLFGAAWALSPTVASYSDHPLITHPTSPPTETRLDHTISKVMGGGLPAVSWQPHHIGPLYFSWTETESFQLIFLPTHMTPPGSPCCQRWCAPVFKLRFPPCVSRTIEPVSRAGWTKPWEREREELLGRNVSHWLCRLDNRVRKEGREHQRGGERTGVHKGEENNTLWTAEIWGFL